MTVRLGLGIASTVGGAPLGAAITGFGGYLIYEGGVNGATALKRIHQDQMNNFDQTNTGALMPNGGSRFPASINNGRPQCPANP